MRSLPCLNEPFACLPPSVRRRLLGIIHAIGRTELEPDAPGTRGMGRRRRTQILSPFSLSLSLLFLLSVVAIIARVWRQFGTKREGERERAGEFYAANIGAGEQTGRSREKTEEVFVRAGKSDSYGEARRGERATGYPDGPFRLRGR